MRSSLEVYAVLVISLIASGSGVATAEIEPQPLDVGLGEYTRVEIVQLPLIVESRNEKQPAACAELKADRLRVIEGGEEMEIIELDPSRLPTIHAILLDTSESMVAGKRIEGSLRAARSYLEWLLPDDRPASPLFGHDAMMLATFDDDLLLHAPLVFLDQQGAKPRLEAAFASINSGFYTTLNDSIAHLTRYLSTYPHRSIIILLSDGGDQGSFYDDETIKKLVNSTNGLTVFAIGLSLDKHQHRAQRRYLQELADASGGTFENVWGLMNKSAEVVADKLEKPFEKIHRRLSREYFVSYESKAFGEGLRDLGQAAGKPFVVRDVEVQALDENCRIRGYKRARYVSRDSSIADIERSSRSVEAGSSDDRAENPNPLTVALQVNDIFQDDGPLWGSSADESRRIAPRTVVVDLAELGGAVPVDPEDVIHDLLLDRAAPIDRIVNGKTLLVYREQLARRIFDESAVYREWCRRRMADDVARELRDRLPQTVTPDQFERILNVRLQQPRTEDIQRYLTTWRGDIHARDMALELEKKEANDLLRADADELSRTLQDVDTIQKRWPELTQWFRKPDKVRILAPLVLTHDPQRDVFGFFRIVLPRFDLRYRHRGRKSIRELHPDPLNPVPDHPLGLQLVRWLLALPVTPGHSASTRTEHAPERTMLAEELRANWRVARIEHEPFRVALEDAGQEQAATRLESVVLYLVGSTEDPDGARVNLKALVLDAAPEPVCLGTAEGRDASALESLIAETGLRTCSPPS